jgi:hypothetical protein
LGSSRLKLLKNLAWWEVAAAALWAAFLIVGIAYWLGAHSQVIRCVFGDSQCSTAIASWILCVVTGLAFIVAARAARWAWETLENERTAELGLRECFQRKHQPHVQRFIDNLVDSPRRNSSDGGDRSTHEPLKFDITNLGRAPIRDAKILTRIRAAGSTDDPTDIDIDLGCFADRETIHITIWVLKALGRLEVIWPTKATLPDGKRVDFHSIDTISYTKFVAGIATLPPPTTKSDRAVPTGAEKPTFDNGDAPA